jgi:hypothetical protein
MAAPVYELDGMALQIEAAFGGGNWTGPVAAKLPGIAAEPAWVSEGAYLGWATPLFDAAGLIVCMDVPWRVASYRILMRHLKADLSRSNRFPGWRRLYRFWRWCGAYYGDRNPHRLNDYGVPSTRSLAAELLRPYAAKLVVCRTNADVAALLRERFEDGST